MAEKTKDAAHYNKIAEKKKAEELEKQEQNQKFQNEIEHWNESHIARKWGGQNEHK